MKIQLISDTHNTLNRFIPSKDADLIIHAGDFNSGITASITPIVSFVNKCKEYNKPCAFVLGNHDYYGYDLFENKIEQICIDLGFNIITPKSNFVFQDFTFIGGLFGTDFKLPFDYFADTFQNEYLAQKYINDFRYIYNKNKLITSEDYKKLFNESLEHLNKYRYKSKIVVVTHFPIHSSCIDPQFAEDSLTPYFINDIDIEGFDHIISGHTHITRRLKVNKTNIYLNASGYSNPKLDMYECLNFDPNYIINIK